MAWISVHEQVVGGKLRNLAKKIGCSLDEALGILVSLWLWAINNAGKDGFVTGADKRDVAKVLNIGIDERYDAGDVVDALISTGWIDMENGLYIHDWEEWQAQWYRALKARERNTERKRKERQRRRQEKEAEQPENVSVTKRDTLKKKDEFELNSRENSADYCIGTEAILNVMQAWNDLANYGVKPVYKLTKTSTRYSMLKARIAEYGVDAVLSAIDKIKTSDFLQGKHGGRAWQITFDWFVRPNNFPKVLEGNYDNKEDANRQPDAGYGGSRDEQFNRLMEQIRRDEEGDG